MDNENRIADLVLEISRKLKQEARGLSHEDKLVTIEWVWMVAAPTERSEALALPGGFTAAQSRQIEQLEKLVAMVRDDKPDLEGERLYQEGDMTGYAKHLRARLKESSDDDKGGA